MRKGIGDRVNVEGGSLYLSCPALALQVQLLKDETEDLGEKVVDGRCPVALLELLGFCATPQSRRILTRPGRPLAARLLLWRRAVQVGDIGTVDRHRGLALHPLGRVPVGSDHLGHLLLRRCSVVAVRLVQLAPLRERLGELDEVGNVEKVVAVPATEDGGHVEAGPVVVRLLGPACPCNPANPLSPPPPRPAARH